MAFRPGVLVGDLTVSTSSTRQALNVTYRTARVSVTEDTYVAHGDSTVTASVGSGIFIPGGQTELIDAMSGSTHMAFIGAVAGKLNLTFGENE